MLITLDTVRADALGYAGGPAETPNIDALAQAGLRFDQAYTSAPTTLPAHASMLTGLYPAAHGVHENGRRLGAGVGLLPEQLRERGYSTSAFVSGYPLARRFGLERGFDTYEDDFGGAVERSAEDTTDRIIESLPAVDSRPVFIWVHYYDAHDPYQPPEPFAARWPDTPYFGEIEYLDREIGRLLDSLAQHLGEMVVVVAGDHGEGLGDHGEELHGNLLYQGVMRVPLLITGGDIEPRVVTAPVSTRRIYHTVMNLAGGGEVGSLLKSPQEVVVAEAMKPYLQYGWQPQVMAVSDRLKAIQAGNSIELYDVIDDAKEEQDLAERQRPSPEMLAALRDYPLPDGEAVESSQLSQEERRKLATLGYVSSVAPAPPPRDDAPRPRDMVELFDDLDLGSALFVQQRWDEAIQVFQRVAREDPENLMVQLRLAVAYSIAGRADVAERHFAMAEGIAPDSIDVKRYLALHYCRFSRLRQAGSILEPLISDLQDNVPALECLAAARLSRGDLAGAETLLSSAASLQPDSVGIQVRLGEARMAQGRTVDALRAFERAKQLDADGFDRHLELGVLYLAAGRVQEAADELELVPAEHPGYPMALFKRAQASVLLREPDSGRWIERARQHEDEITRPLIENEALFER